MRKNLILIGVVMLMAVPAYAHLYVNDFEAQTVGLNVTAEKHNDWWWYTPGAAGVFADDGGNKVLDLGGEIGLGGQTHLNISGYTVDDMPEWDLNYEFDIKIFDYSRWDIYWTDNVTSTVISATFCADGAASVRYKIDFEGEDPQIVTYVPVPGLVLGQWLHVSVQLDQYGERHSMNIAGTQITTNEYLKKPNGNGGNWAISTERLIFEVPGSVLVDNMVITPEPATIGLLGLGGLLLRRKRRA